MRRIISLELAGTDYLECDLYDIRGELIHEKGKLLTPNLLIQLCHIPVYVVDTKKELKHKSIIPDKVAKVLVDISRNFLKKLSLNQKPDFESCKEAADIIYEEVNSKIDEIDCISQLKVFDEYTFSHTINVSTMSSAIGITLGMEEDALKELALGALLHDIGKMLVPKEILNKPGKLNDEEKNIMHGHSLLGYKYLKDNTDLPDRIAKVALDHQENYNGGGYPSGLKGKEIEFYAQIASIADVFDALTSNRVYKTALSTDKALEIMMLEAKDKFNPYIFDKFVKLVDYKKNAEIIGED